MTSFSLLNDNMIITVPFASSYWIVFKDGSATQLETDKHYYPLCQEALNLDHKALPPEIFNNATLGELSLIIANFNKPYSYMNSLRKLQNSAVNFGGKINRLKTLRYFEEQEVIKLSSAKKVNLIKLCLLLQTDLDYATLSLTIKNDEIMNRLSMSSKSLTAAFKTLRSLELINTENRTMKHLSLPQRITFSKTFFERLLGMNISEIDQVQQYAIKHINEMVLRKYTISRVDERKDNEHYLTITKLLETYESISKEQSEDELIKKQIFQKFDQAASDFLGRKNALRNRSWIENVDVNTVDYSQSDILKAYETVELSMQHTKEKVKKLILNLDTHNIKEPGVIKAIVNLL